MLDTVASWLSWNYHLPKHGRQTPQLREKSFCSLVSSFLSGCAITVLKLITAEEHL